MTDIVEPVWIIVYGGDGRPVYVVHEGGEKMLCNSHDEIKRIQREGIEALATKFERMTDHTTAALVRSVGGALVEDSHD